MIIQKRKSGKKKFAVILTSSILALLIIAYAVISAVLPNLTPEAEEGNTPSTLPELISGESTYGNMAVIYPYVHPSSILSVSIKSHEDTFMMSKPTDSEGKRLDYFLFSYVDPLDGEVKMYLPSIVDEDADFDYTDLYAIEQSNTLGVYKIDYLCAAVGALYFDNRITLSENASEKEAQLNRYGLGKDERETIRIEYLGADGNAKTHTVYVGNKLITGVGYYFMLDGRDCVYTSTASDTLSYALGGFEKFITSRIISAEVEGDNGAAPYHTGEYSQWVSTYHSTLGSLVPSRSEAVVRADYIQPIYQNVLDNDGNVVAYESGYRNAGADDLTFDLAALRKSPEFSSLINTLVGKPVGALDDKASVTVITDLNEATLFDSEKNTGIYEYTILAVEAVLTDAADITAEGASVGSGSKVKVEYTYTVDGTRPFGYSSHAVIDLSSSVIPTDVKEALVLSGIGRLDSPVSFTVKYTEDNVRERRIQYVISDISLIFEVDETDSGLTPLSTVTDKSIVTFTYRYLLDGVEMGKEDLITLPLGDITAGFNLKIKEALVGKTSGKQNITVTDNVAVQALMDFRTYEIESILGYVTIDQTVSFGFVPESQRDPFHAESIYKNILPEENKYSAYAMNDEACDEVLRIISGISTDSTGASGATGLVGSETVAVGLTHKNMEYYKLYDGYRIFFELPRGLNSVAGSSDYGWLDRIGFTLYIGTEVQPDGTIYVGSDLYDIVVKIDASTFDFLKFSFTEYWARRNLAMIDVADISKLSVELSMSDVYGKYEFQLGHKTIYIVGEGAYNVLPEGIENYTEYDYISVTVNSLSDRRTETAFSSLLESVNQSTGTQGTSLGLAAIYNSVGGATPGQDLYEGYDTLGTASFKEMLRLVYSTYYLGSLTDGEQALATEANKVMEFTFDLGDNSDYTYNYKFHRIDDRRVLVSLTRVNEYGEYTEPVSDFYISTLAFKKIVSTFTCLLNGVEIDPDLAYQ